MGLYRTKPEEVEAIQYTGGAAAPFSTPVPAWVWTGLSTGKLSFTAHGLEINYNGLTEMVGPEDWLVMSSDGVIRAAEDKVFRQYYLPFRKRRTKAEIASATGPISVAGQNAGAADGVTDADLDAILASVGSISATAAE